jgi:hypothetical protein
MGLSAVWFLVAGGMVLLGIATLVRVKRVAPRPASWGVLAVAAGLAGIALAIGVGRGGMGEFMGIWSRYSLLTWPLLGLAYVVWLRDGTPWGRRWVPMGLCVAAAVAFPGNMVTGVAVGVQVKTTLTEIENLSRNGTPPAEIVRVFHGTTQAGQEERAVRGIPLLRQARIGRFAEN